MTPEERAAKCYREMWEGNSTHSTEFVIAGIARAIREAQEEAVKTQQTTIKCGECGRECEAICTHCYHVE